MAVLRIPDILVQIRIRGSVHLTTGPDPTPVPDPTIFVSDLRWQLKFICYLSAYFYKNLKHMKSMVRVSNTVPEQTKVAKKFLTSSLVSGPFISGPFEIAGFGSDPVWTVSKVNSVVFYFLRAEKN